VTPLRLAVLLSGSGRTLENLVRRIADGSLPARIEGVVSSKEGVRGIQVAREAHLPLAEVPRSRFSDDASFGTALASAISPWKPDFIVLAGFLHYLPMRPEWRGRVVNIHPALLPRFGGKGFYGDRVHRAVLRAGERESGCTVHWVDDVYDHGATILQKRVPVLPADTVESLAARVFAAECDAYPEALASLARSR
jgi:formyltetrahydrofolate-dependent phosphoribosylglycinamide formyltransferase